MINDLFDGRARECHLPEERWVGAWYPLKLPWLDFDPALWHDAADAELLTDVRREVIPASSVVVTAGVSFSPHAVSPTSIASNTDRIQSLSFITLLPSSRRLSRARRPASSPDMSPGDPQAVFPTSGHTGWQTTLT